MTAPANPWASDPTAQNVQPPDAYVAIGFVDEEPISAAYLNWALSNVYGVNLCITHSTGSEICIEDDGDILIHGISDVQITGDAQLLTSSPFHRHVIDNAGGFWAVVGDNGGAGDAIITVQYTSGGASYVTVSADEHSFVNAAGSATWLFIDEDVVSSGIGFYASGASPLHGTRYGYAAQTVKIELSPWTGGWTLIQHNGLSDGVSFGTIDYDTNATITSHYTRPLPLDSSGSQASIVWRLDSLVVDYMDLLPAKTFQIKIRRISRSTGVVSEVADTGLITPGTTGVFITHTTTITGGHIADLDTYSYFIWIELVGTTAGANSHYTEQIFKRIQLTCTKYAAD